MVSCSGTGAAQASELRLAPAGSSIDSSQRAASRSDAKTRPLSVNGCDT